MSDLDAIRERHQQQVKWGPMPFCGEDRSAWPCDTAQLIAALDAQPVGLDVERLARAIKVEGESGRWSDSASHVMRFMDETLAALIAETYAALASEPQP